MLLLLLTLAVLLRLGLPFLSFRLGFLLLFRRFSVLFLLCVRGRYGSKNKEQNARADNPDCFHDGCLHNVTTPSLRGRHSKPLPQGVLHQISLVNQYPSVSAGIGRNPRSPVLLRRPLVDSFPPWCSRFAHKAVS